MHHSQRKWTSPISRTKRTRRTYSGTLNAHAMLTFVRGAFTLAPNALENVRTFAARIESVHIEIHRYGQSCFPCTRFFMHSHHNSLATDRRFRKKEKLRNYLFCFNIYFGRMPFHVTSGQKHSTFATAFVRGKLIVETYANVWFSNINVRECVLLRWRGAWYNFFFNIIRINIVGIWLKLLFIEWFLNY